MELTDIETIRFTYESQKVRDEKGHFHPDDAAIAAVDCALVQSLPPLRATGTFLELVGDWNHDVKLTGNLQTERVSVVESR